MAEMTTDDEVVDIKRRSKALRTLLDYNGVRKFHEGSPRLEPIKACIDISHTLEVAKYLYLVVKDKDERERFFADPKQALTDVELADEVGNSDMLLDIANSLIERNDNPIPTEIFDSYTDSKTETHQQYNFDSSGQSSESKTGSMVGENKDFSGFGLVEEIFGRPEFGESFFPQQPLVSPALIAKIRARLSANV